MPIATLVKVSPMDTATGSRVDIYLSNMGDADMGARVNGLGGNVWVPALTTSPVLSMRTWNGDFTAAVEPGEARLAFTLGPVKRRVPAVETLYWAGAPIEVYAEEVGTAWPWTARFAGNVRDYAGSKRKWTLTAAVDERKFARNVLTASYFGTGGIEGGGSLKGKVKPLVLGWATNVEPVLIDAVNNVYQFSGYGPIEGVTTLYERGSAFPASTGDYASYSALVAATIPNGGWATSLAYGLIRLGAPQYGVITGDVKGHKVGASTPRLPGAVISALATIAGVSTGDLNTTSLTAFDTGVPYPINLFIDGQVEFADMAREIALSCNWVAGISLKGKFFAAPVSLTPAAAVTLNAQGSAKPQVLETSEKSVSLPYWKTVLGAQRVWRVHSADEIAFTEELAVTGYLTKEAASLSATSAGVVSDFSPASGTFKVLQGQIDRTTDSTFSLVSATGATATINATTGAYSVSAMSADSATVTFQAVYNGVTLTKVLSLTKAKTGAAGSDGTNNATVTLYRRSASSPAMPSGTFTYTFATGVLSGGTLNGWTQAAPATDGNPLWTITAAASSSAATASVTAASFSAAVKIVQDGTAGGSGTAALSIVVTKKAVGLASYANGDVTDFSPAAGQLTVYLGNTDVTASATLSATASGCTGTINTATNTPVSSQPKGYYRVTAMSADTATLTLTATYSGQTLTEVFALSKAKGGYEIVGALPSTNLFEGRVVYLTTDDKLYRYTGSAWTAAVPAVDLTGTITTTQITDGAISTPKLAANAVTANELAADAVTANKILAGAVTTNKLDAGAVTAAKLATTELITISAQIGDGVITNAKIGNLEVDSAKIANLTVGTNKITDNAITQSVSAFTATMTPVVGVSYGAIQSCTITAEAGDVVDIVATMNAEFISGSNTVLNFRFVRGSTVIYQAYSWTPQYICPAFVDIPGAGTHTYELQVANAGLSCEIDVSNRYMRLLRARK